MFEWLNNKKIKITILAIGIIATVFLFTFQLGTRAFKDYDEAGYAEIIKETRNSGQFMTLIVEDKPWFDKPPLQFWAGELFWKAGLSPEWAFRLPGALAGIASIILMYLLVVVVSGSVGAGLLSALILLTTGAYLMTSREFKLDVPVTLFLLLGVYAWVKGRKNDTWLLGVGISSGIAVMIKSVMGIFVYPMIIAYAIGHNEWKWLKNKWFWIGNIGGVLAASVWHIYEWVKHGQDFLNGYILWTIFQRFNSDLLNNGGTVWTYVAALKNFAMPWAIVFIVIVFLAALGWKKIPLHVRGTLIGSSLIVLGLFLFFAKSQTKIPYYLIPLYPFIAITIGLGVYSIWKNHTQQWLKITLVAVMSVLVIVGARQAFSVGFNNNQKFNIEHRFAEEEKIMAAILHDKKDAKVVYFDDDWYNLTIRFYSDKKVSILDKEHIQPRPLYLVLFLQKAYDWPFYQELLKNAEPLYKGEYYGLYKVN